MYNLTKKLAKATTFISVVVSSVLFITSCSNSGQEIKAPEGMHVLNLSRYGKPFSIFVPDTTKIHLVITEQSSGALEITAGNNFGVSINEQHADLDLLRSDLKADDVNKLKSMIVDEPEAIMWESEIVQPEFHFFINKKINNANYSFEDIKSTEAEPFKKEATQRMFDACKNVQATAND